MIKIPINSKWSQLNNSDKFGSLAYSKNINLDNEGYLKLSPRTVNLFDDSGNTTNVADDDFDYPVAFGRSDSGTMKIATTDEPFNLTVSDTQKNISEDSGSNNPNLSIVSHGCWWQNRFYESTDTAVYYNSAGTWTANAITGLTSGVRHYMAVFKNRRTLCVSNGNVVKQYDTSHSGSTDLTLPSDYEVIGMAYNNNKMGIITRLGNDTAGQNANAYFFTWDGGSTEAGSGIDIGCYSGISVVAYKSSFVIITSSGQILYWNGGGFEELAHFPFYVSESALNNLLGLLSFGDNLVVDGDVIYINLGFDFGSSAYKGEEYIQNNPCGVWCYDPKIGLYHRYSPSLSKTYLHTVTSGNVDLATDIFTTSSTIPETGNPLIVTQGVSGVTLGKVYFVIKLSPTTFSIAETKDLALAGVKVNITAVDSNNYIWMYDIIDYGISYFTRSGAIAIWGTSRKSYRDVIFGGRYIESSNLAARLALCTAVPELENRGYLITPKLYLDSITENIQKLYVKYSPLDVNDKIIIKVKTKNFVGIPSSTPSTLGIGGLTWTGSKEGSTAADLSEVKTAFDAGEEVEIEFTAGIGAGQMVKITNIAYGGGTYALTFEENVVGATSGLKSYYIIDNWKVFGTISETGDGWKEIPIAKSTKVAQFKIELRGYETTIEDMGIITKPQIPA